MMRSLVVENFLDCRSPTELATPQTPLNKAQEQARAEALRLLASVPEDLEAAILLGEGAAQRPYGWASPGSRKAVVSLTVQFQKLGQPLQYCLQFSLVNGHFSITNELVELQPQGPKLYWYENGSRRQLLQTAQGLRELPHQQVENRRSVLSWREVRELVPELDWLARQLEGLRG